MKTFFIPIIIFISFTSCFNCDFSIKSEYRSLMSYYSVNDTLTFSSNLGNTDSIVIIAIDSFQECGTLMAGKRKEISYQIRHLPENKWNGGIELNQNGTSKILNQEIIVIEKMIGNDGDMYFILVNYQDFSEELKPEFLKNDNYLKKYGVNHYWEILNNKADNSLNSDFDSNSVSKVIWTNKYGLTEYTKKNGEKFKINL